MLLSITSSGNPLWKENEKVDEKALLETGIALWLINSDIVNYLLPLVQKAQDFKINNINLSTANVLTTGNIANTQIIRPKAGLYNWTGIQNFISKEISN